MSASFQPDDTDWLKMSLKQGIFDPTEITILESVFDDQTDYDIRTIEKQVEKEKFLRKVCLCKLIVFPLEYLAILGILGYDQAKKHFTLIKAYKDFYNKKISFSQFQHALTQATTP